VLQASRPRTKERHTFTSVTSCLDATTTADAGFTGKNALGSSATPRRIADPSACVWQVKSGVVVVNVVEIDGAVRRERLL
jgi:hypothetical protein